MSPSKSYLYALLTVLLWSTMAPVVKVLLNGIPNFQALCIGSLFAFFYLMIDNLVHQRLSLLKNYRRSDYMRMVGLGFLGLFVYSTLYYYGLSVLSAGKACILNYLWPIMIVVFSIVILKEKVTLLKVVALMMSFVGILILSYDGFVALDIKQISGMISCLLAAGCYGLFSVLNKKYNDNQNIAMMIFWLTAALGALTMGLISEQWVFLSLKEWIGFVYLGVFVNGLAYLLWALALNNSNNTAVIANMAYLTPFLSLIMAALLLHEPLTFQTLIATVIIISGVLLQSHYDQKP